MIGNRKKTSPGFSLLIAVLMIGGVATLYAVGVGLRDVNDVDIAFTRDKTQETRNSVDNCSEEALEQLRLDNNYAGGVLSVAGNSCIIEITANGNDRAVIVTSTIDIYTQVNSIDVTLQAGTVSVTSWARL